MLNKETLSQLSSLKKEIRASRDVQEGTVTGTTGRFGFVCLDDGRDAFLCPDEMDKVLHGDRIEVLVSKNDKDQYEAKIEKLIHSPQKQIAGRYVIKGKGHFVAVETQQHSRWIFVPPKARNNAQEGHLVTAKITQHPFETGKVQAKILADLGSESNLDTIRKYTLAQFQLFENFPRDVEDQAKKIQTQPIELKPGLSDLREESFVTIDSASTRDMDDALAIEANENGWKLKVAIACPSLEIDVNSPLGSIAQRRSQSIYTPGKPIPMLPETLSQGHYSLISGQDRYALVCNLDVNSNGKVTDFGFTLALVRSQAKLSYQQVSKLLNDQPFVVPEQLDDATPHKQSLLTLQACSAALLQHRSKHELVTQNRDDFIFIINEDGKLESIEKLEPTIAHSIVEEAMIATNQCAGKFLAEKQTGVWVTHPGYRNERRADIEKLLAEQLSDKDFSGGTESLETFVQTMHQLQSSDQYHNLLAIQQRFLQGSELSIEPKPHFGLGAEHYANITSPIRRYQDLINQRLILNFISGKFNKKLAPNAKTIAKLNENASNARNAKRFVEQWLIADYMQDKIGQTFSGYIALLTNQGVGVRLHSTGIEGFVVATKEDKKNSEAPYDKISFNNQRMELTWNGTPLHYDQTVEVRLVEINHYKKKLVFAWADESFCKQEKEADSS